MASWEILRSHFDRWAEIECRSHEFLLPRTILIFSPYNVRDILLGSLVPHLRGPGDNSSYESFSRPQSVQRFLTHLTLIAYLVGGWLLPAAHHHAPQVVSHGHGLNASCCVSADHHHAAPYQEAAADVPNACQSTERCDCGHDAVAPQRVIDADIAVSSSQTHPHDCVGLCAGCVAQSLVGTHVGDQAEFTWIDNSHGVFLTDPGMVLSKRYGFALSRGPPAAV